jgi:soluble lytic murein transglycosylase-like protein
MLRFFPILVVVSLAAAAPADAQIYSWRDAAGRLVLSNRPMPGGATEITTYAVSGPSLLSTTAPPVSTAGEERYDDLIREQARQNGLSPDLVRAVIRAESGFNPHAISPKGAMGLMQLMPATARELGVVDPFHPAENIRGGVTYLARLLARSDQKLELALAAYNAGPGAVERYGAVPPYRETRSYIEKITRTTAAAAPMTSLPSVIYKWIVQENGSISTRYSNVPPQGIDYQIVGRR